MSKKHWKIIVDILMLGTIFILFQTGEKDIMLHMAFGILMTMLFIVHNILNLSWWMSIGKGRYNMLRIAMTILNCLLLLNMLTVIFSGILFAGTLHRFSSLIFLLLMVGHLGMHCVFFIRRKKKK
jgi:hypothetical protein